MNKQQIKELLVTEEMEVNESEYLKQILKQDRESLLTEQTKGYTEEEIKEFKEFLNHKYNKQMEEQKVATQTNFLDRLIQEQKELQEKKIKLADFLSKGNIVDIVGERQHKYLMLQLQTMETYNMILEMRILDLQSK